MCAIVTRKTYTVTARGLELERGTKFTVKPGAVKDGQLVLALAGSHRVIGRFYAAVGGCDWLCQPSRLIRISNPADVRIEGVINAT
jgi:hypothetical protein